MQSLNALREPVMVGIRRLNRLFPLSEHSGDEPEGSRPLQRFERSETSGKLGGNAESSVPVFSGIEGFSFSHLDIIKEETDNA